MTYETAATAESRPFNLGNEDGLVEVSFQSTTVTIDLVAAWEKFLSHSQQHRDEADFSGTLPALAQTLGLPEMSQRVALRLFNGLARLVEEMRTADGIEAPEAPPDPEMPPMPTPPMPDLNGTMQEARNVMAEGHEAMDAIRAGAESMGMGG